MWGIFPVRYQADVRPTDIAIRDVVRFTRINAAEQQSLNPNGRYQANPTGSYFLDSTRAGTHDLKAGLQLSWEQVEYERIRNGDYFLELQRRPAVPGAARQHPDQLRPSAADLGRVPAGSLGRRACDDQRSAAGRRRERLSAGADQPGRQLRRGAQLPEDRRVRLRSQRRAAPGHLLRPVRQRAGPR